MKRISLYFFVIILIVGLLVGCMVFGPKEPDPVEKLRPGEVLTGIDGVSVGAPEGALEKDIELFIEKISDPRAEVAFPDDYEGLEIIGDFYEVSSSEEYWARHGNYLIVALPVPEWASSNKLAILSLSPSEMIITDSSNDIDLMRWSLLDGAYDKESGLFATVLPYVGTMPLSFALVMDESCSLCTIDAQTDTGRFDVQCKGWLWFGRCTQDHIDYTKQALNKVYDIYVTELGFNEPALRRKVENFSLFPFTVTLSSQYQYELIKGAPNGYYDPATQIAATVYRGDPNYPNPLTAYHEFFHALQWGYEGVSDAWDEATALWGIIEGTATLAEKSLEGLTRSNRPLAGREPLPIDVALFARTASAVTRASRNDYRTQDFWAFVGKRIGSPYISFLIPLFERGARLNDIDAFLQVEGTFSSLGSAYWQWAKNQSFEKEIVLGYDSEGFEVPHGEPCSWSGHGNITNMALSKEDLAYGEILEFFSLKPLSSHVFEITLLPQEQEYSAAATIWRPHPDINFKFYSAKQTEACDCFDTVHDNTPYTFTVESKDVTAYLLVSNINIYEPLYLIGLKFLNPPFVEKIDGPDGTIVDSVSTFTWTGRPKDSIVRYEYSKNGENWIDHEKQETYTWDDYPEGPNSYEVRAYDRNGVYSEPVVWNFTYELSVPLTPPDILSPGYDYAPGEVINTLTPTMYWEEVEEAVSYALAISVEPYGTPNLIYNPQYLYGDSLTIPEGVLEWGKKYRWNMQARSDDDKLSEVSNTLYFQTEEDYEVIFEDPNLEQVIREVIGKPTGAIYRSDVHSLRTLNASGKGIDSLEGIQHLRSLEILRLEGDWATGKLNYVSDITPLSNLTNLIWLSFQENSVSDVSPLSDLTNLEWLWFWGNSVSDISALSGLTNLTWLDFRDNLVEDISALTGLTKLDKLRLCDNQVNDISVLAGLTKLECLSFGSNKVNCISPLAGLKNLTDLHISWNLISDISPLAGLNNLVSLVFQENSASDISPLEGLKNLEILMFWGNSVSDISPLIGLTSLRQLEFVLNLVSDISPLAGLTNLEWLNFQFNLVSDISALVENQGFGENNSIYMSYNYLDLTPGSQNMIDIQTLLDRGVDVRYQPQREPGDTADAYADYYTKSDMKDIYWLNEGAYRWEMRPPE